MAAAIGHLPSRIPHLGKARPKLGFLGGGEVATNELLARWVARRQVLCLPWNGEVWLPQFQFEYQYMTVKPTLEPVFATLNPVLSPWKLANWCAQPHPELDGESPADALNTSAAQVLRAACADSLALD